MRSNYFCLSGSKAIFKAYSTIFKINANSDYSVVTQAFPIKGIKMYPDLPSKDSDNNNPPKEKDPNLIAGSNTLKGSENKGKYPNLYDAIMRLKEESDCGPNCRPIIVVDSTDPTKAFWSNDKRVFKDHVDIKNEDDCMELPMPPEGNILNPKRYRIDVSKAKELDSIKILYEMKRIETLPVRPGTSSFAGHILKGQFTLEQSGSDIFGM